VIATACEGARVRQQRAGRSTAHPAQGEWNGNINDRAFLMVGVPA